MDNSYFICWKV